MKEYIVDKEFCMCSYLMYRYVFDKSKCFYEDHPCEQVSLDFDRIPVKTSEDLLESLREATLNAFEGKRCALALSGGMDSAILARLVPKGTKVYTFKCIVPGVEVADETKTASEWACLNHLDHEIVEIYWEDVVRAAERCMLHKNAPIHSIETQIYLAAKRATEEGIERMIFGENADIIYGGMNGLLAKDWTYSEFVDRYTYVMPYKVLKRFIMPMEPYLRFNNNGYVDGHDFINEYFRQEALGTYKNACETAGVDFVGPYSQTELKGKIDYKRIRNGDSKYLIREVFRKLYPEMSVPVKIPMPRPMDQWLSDWPGPARTEFVEGCVDGLSGDQRWMLWSLERFLDLMEEE